MDNTQGPNITDPLHNLFENQSGLLLCYGCYVCSDFQKYAQIIAIRIFLHHVDIRSGLDSLVQSN